MTNKRTDNGKCRCRSFDFAQDDNFGEASKCAGVGGVDGMRPTLRKVREGWGTRLISTEHRGTADGKPLRLSFSDVSVKVTGSDNWILRGRAQDEAISMSTGKCKMRTFR
jgi:hypothetical protein